MHAYYSKRYYINPNYAIGAAPLQERTQKLSSAPQNIPAYQPPTAQKSESDELKVNLNGSLVTKLKKVVAVAGDRVMKANKRGHQLRTFVDIRPDSW